MDSPVSLSLSLSLYLFRCAIFSFSSSCLFSFPSLKQKVLDKETSHALFVAKFFSPLLGFSSSSFSRLHYLLQELSYNDNTKQRVQESAMSLSPPGGERKWELKGEPGLPVLERESKKLGESGGRASRDEKGGSEPDCDGEKGAGEAGSR